MQFHLDGFKAGDPSFKEPADMLEAVQADEQSLVDVLIVGCGPAGLTLAAQLSTFPNIVTRIVDQKPGPLELGQADGIACRTMEMFNAFGFAGRLMDEAYWVNEVTFWKPDDEDPSRVVRSGRVPDTEDGLSEFPHVILNQARVHDHYLEVMKKSPHRLEPSYSRKLLDLTVSANGGGDAYPVTARFERLDRAPGENIETVRARYVVGCDGARSAVRKSIGQTLKGDSANQAWGVMDVLAVTDFPDIRLKAAIHSASEGSILIIPREGGYLVRLYIELDKLDENERISSKNVTADQLIAAANRILHPYTIDVKEIAWWSVYEIGQRVCDKFDDALDDESGSHPRIFIAGDACHTHSPKAGQGMNVSMQDSFNLGWKLAAVLNGRSSPSLLHTYSAERRAIAQELIDFDREFAKMFSAAPKDADNPQGIDPAEFQRYFIQHGRFTAGTATQYKPSMITLMSKSQELARGFPVGMRFHSAPVIRFADAKSMQLGHVLEADGRWRILIFAHSHQPLVAGSPLLDLCHFLREDPRSPLNKFTPRAEEVDSVFDVRAIFQQRHDEISVENLPALLLPRKGRHGLIDYEKAFCSDNHASRDIFAARGISRELGCAVIVRPDQYVAGVLSLAEADELVRFFDRFMLLTRDNCD
ncbi:3-hydroxybenzoate 4-monooxygenase [Sphingobium lactosutens]|uniref:FAD-binding monooxygenase n=1 Tax=Sphingobium lactosutens TaxID=522773 RepID=UPI0015B8563F|nr:FAD-binding monooxygenase [Sphingobium lactosutens]NWK97504.1 3-hydroxybenzoate 4-monooxygenase [Sphingobium lactosutens]